MEERTRTIEEALREHLTQENHRLDRIEGKLDKLTDTVVALARAEEKLVNLEKSRQDFADAIDNHDERLDAVEGKVSSLEMTSSIISKLFWIVVTVGVGYELAALYNG